MRVPEATPLVQRAAAPASAPAPSLTASAAGLAMPLARSSAPAASGSAPAGGSGVIQRQAVGGGSSETASISAAPVAENSVSVAGGNAAGPDIDEVVDRVMRRLTRTLAVESERHGGRRWP